MSSELVVYEGRQYPADKLPAGVKLADCVPVAEWFEKNRTPAHKAIVAPEPSKPTVKPGKS